MVLFLAGDVMLGRGVDQILAHPVEPTLHEAHVDDARTYVELAERVNGPIPRPVDASWPWGDALRVLDEVAPDARVVNLETAVTLGDEFAAGKSVHYRMAPDNLACLLKARPDACVLANNHVLDFGVPGLEDTLDTLAAAQLPTAGAGRDFEAARQPVAITLPDDRRVLVFAYGDPSSGIPATWAATPDRAGIAFLDRPSSNAASELLDAVGRHRRPGDVVIVSIHWGSNWGYDVPQEQRSFAHALIDGGVDVVHGHSSHHPRPIEVYRDRLILYGCGDLVNDYEGIGGHEQYRGDLRLLYLVSLPDGGAPAVDLRMIPMRARRMRLEHASQPDADWLAAALDDASRPFGVRVVRTPAGELALDQRAS